MDYTSPSGVAWVSVAGSAGLSEVYDKQGNELIPGGVTIPSPGSSTMGGHPSGQIFNGTSDFKLPTATLRDLYLRALMELSLAGVVVLQLYL